MRRRKLNQDGKPPIGRAVFYASKYAVLVVWLVMVLQNWGIPLGFFTVPAFLHWSALALWACGFALLFLGRWGMRESFRIGSPEESTSLKVNGLFRYSRNPMYVGVGATLLAAILSTLNPIVLAIVVFVAAVHHRIVLAEERHLGETFGEAYRAYCLRVRRYL